MPDSSRKELYRQALKESDAALTHTLQSTRRLD
jgi:hypothetical protein